jgi:NAD(P)-dependent dehydrogenase (short-subunit alcohol dehydrogenase family)
MLVAVPAEPNNVVVTGAGGGLGRALVGDLTRRGATVFAVDLIFSDPPASGEFRLEADLSLQGDVDRVVDQIAQRTSAIDLLINGAATFIADRPGESGWRDIEQLLRTNVTSTIMLSLALESLLVNGSNPSVVNIGSTDGVVASAGQDCEIGVAHDLFYATSKGAVVAFTRALAMKWARQGIRVNVVCPTVFGSPMTESLLAEEGAAERLAQHVPMRRLADVSEVAEAVLGLHRLGFTTGHMLPVDGGYLCR